VGSFGDCVSTVMSAAATLLHKCLQLRLNMSGDACHRCYFFQICVIGWVGSNCDCVYVKVVFLILGGQVDPVGYTENYYF
jgi:hypothetical protein